MYDQHDKQQNLLLASLGPLVAEGDKHIAIQFAEALGASLLSYDPVNSLWRLSDGELYSMDAMRKFLESGV